MESNKDEVISVWKEASFTARIIFAVMGFLSVSSLAKLSDSIVAWRGL